MLQAQKQATIHAKKNGMAKGRQLGSQHGYNLGRRDAIRMQYLPDPPPARCMRVLYIAQGFHAIDGGIEKALRHAVSEVTAGSPDQMLALAEQVRPDLMLVMNGLHGFPENQGDQISRIRELGTRTVLWFADDPYFTDRSASIAPYYDVVLTHEQSCVPFYMGRGCRQVAYLPLAADTDVFRPQRVEHQYHTDICFIGVVFWNRAAFFDRIAHYLVGKNFKFAGGEWQRLQNYQLLQHRIYEGFVPVEETAKYYSGAKIVINLHRHHAHPTDNFNSLGIPALSINPRTYEMAACGTLQLTDFRSDLAASYAPGKEIVVYHSPEDFIAKAEYYLTHEAEREAIALNALRRTLEQHSYTTRIQQLLQLLGY
ncbi:CgeB family protein [Paenibacillus xerothermodurans]|uniref:Spore maturation protein n=1 Tax=Paenibacillus xerothermodurans TaxID=1977292 RepID=A0A2W1NC31_PAEXE|nr:glycosyltransferase [Paenibacillus xerothermodurans]PZE20611.1 spore maturation protein [Paenibacillus xerothermodurans]